MLFFMDSGLGVSVRCHQRDIAAPWAAKPTCGMAEQEEHADGSLTPQLD